MCGGLNEFTSKLVAMVASLLACLLVLKFLGFMIRLLQKRTVLGLTASHEHSLFRFMNELKTSGVSSAKYDNTHSSK